MQYQYRWWWQTPHNNEYSLPRIMHFALNFHTIKQNTYAYWVDLNYVEQILCEYNYTIHYTGDHYVSPHEMGRHFVLFLAPLSVCLSVHHTFVSALYLLNPWWDFHDDVQCLCLTKVGSRSSSQSKIKHCMTVFRVRSISFELLVGLTNYFAQMSAMLWRCAVPMFDQVGSRSRSEF